MQCKVFSIPLDSGSEYDRDRKLDEFLGAKNVKRVFASLANQPEGPVWSILFFYEGGAEVVQQPPVSTSHTKPCQEASEDRKDLGGELTRDQVRSIVALKKWRAEQAAQEGVPLYMVAQNKWLEEMVRIPVNTAVDLLKVQGLGEWRVKKYGAKIVEVLSAGNGSRSSASSYAAGRA
jgi:superfamily II DNA helicase RecQ